jgi:DNA-3-methyladenine glycosylase II
MAARAINNRFRGLFGYKEDDEEGFPSPADVVKKDVLVLKSAGLSMRKAEYGEFFCV